MSEVWGEEELKRIWGGGNRRDLENPLNEEPQHYIEFEIGDAYFVFDQAARYAREMPEAEKLLRQENDRRKYAEGEARIGYDKDELDERAQAFLNRHKGEK